MVPENGNETENCPDNNTHYMRKPLHTSQILYFENCYLKQVIHNNKNCTTYNKKLKIN
jgi:hypothetical protein